MLILVSKSKPCCLEECLQNGKMHMYFWFFGHTTGACEMEALQQRIKPMSPAVEA